MSLFSKVWFQQHLGWKVFSNKWRHDSSLLVPLCATAQYRVSLTQLTDCAVSSNFGTPRLDTERPRQGHGVVVVSERSNFGKCILNNWTNLFVTWTNTNCNLVKFILMGNGYGVVVMSAWDKQQLAASASFVSWGQGILSKVQIHFWIWRNTFCCARESALGKGQE